MALPVLTTVCDLLRVRADDVAGRVLIVLATALLATVAGVLLTAAGLVALAREIGFPGSALVFALLFALAALATHLLGQRLAARRLARVAAAQSRAAADIALAATLARSSRPLLPVVAFLAAFALARRS
jgi:hypothetical protein